LQPIASAMVQASADFSTEDAFRAPLYATSSALRNWSI